VGAPWFTKMVKEDKSTWKAKYFEKVNRLFDDYPRCFIVCVDNVRSLQMMQIRKSLRGQAELLMGKNTMMKKAMKICIQKNPALEKVSNQLRGNVGLVFTREDACDIKEKILENRVAAPAKAGAIAPVEVIVPAQNTGLGPEKTSFFQALQIQTKISKGTIEILNDVKLISPGDKVGASEATLLSMLKIHPFTYGLVILKVYDNGTIFDPEVLDLTDAELLGQFAGGVSNLAALCMAVNYPCMASAPHMLRNATKNILSIALAADINYPEADKVRDILSDPSKLAALAGPAVGAAPAAAAESKAAAPVEEEEEEDEDMSLSLFD